MGEKTKQSTKAPLFGGRELLFSQRELLLLVGPLLVEQLLEVTVGMADTMMVSRCGEAAISGVSLVDMINNLIIVLFAALATGGAVVVSQYLGAREQKKADASSGQLILLSALLGAGVALFCFVLARPMLRLCYGSIEADVLDAGVLYLKITALSYPFLALYNAGAALFRSMGNSKISIKISNVNNYCIAVKEKGDDIVFLRKIVKGGADKSYGIQVAKLAGVPDPVINRAKEIVEELVTADITGKVKDIAVQGSETKKKTQKKLDEVDLTQFSLFDTVKDDDVLNELKELDISHMTPMDAMNKLYQLQNKLRNRW